MRFRSVYVAGHGGLVGSAVVRNLEKNGYPNILVRSHRELDLRNPEDVRKFFSETKPEAVVIAAAKVGGIQANSAYPVEFLLENLQIQNNLVATLTLLDALVAHGVKDIVFSSSAAVYGTPVRVPLDEEHPIEPLSPRQLNRAIHAAAQDAQIEKHVSMHTLRHSFATHLLEQKVDIRVIQVLLRHKKLETTSLYTQVATEILREVVSPLDTLQPS